MTLAALAIDAAAVQVPIRSDLALVERLKAESGARTRVSYHAGTGMVRFIGTDPGQPVRDAAFSGASSSPEVAARAFLARYAPLFGVRDQAELAPGRVKVLPDGRTVVRFAQRSKGLPVFSGEIQVQLDVAKNVTMVLGRLSPRAATDVAPAVSPDEAGRTAVEAVAGWNSLDPAGLVFAPPELMVYNPALVGPGRNETYLVWRIEVDGGPLSPVKELVLVDARSGPVLLHFSLRPSALHREIWDAANKATFNWNPDAPLREEGDAAVNQPQADNLYDYLGDVYDYYLYNNGRDSRDGNGMKIRGIVRYCPNTASCPYGNANGGDPMVFGDGYVTDDIVGHEYTHTVTSYESNLNYYAQSGAINESFSDIWGEFVDLSNGRGNDAAAVRWQLGEDRSSGAMRDMKNPPAHGQPDRMSSPLYWCSEDDAAGVHFNSGIGNKAAYLLSDGGTFNGHSIGPIGMDATIRIFYEAQANILVSGSDYADLYDALYQGCLNLLGTAGITLSDCQQVRKTTQATEMDMTPTACSVYDAPRCDTGPVNTLFFDDFEYAASGNWDLGQGLGSDSKNWGWWLPPSTNPRRQFTYAVSGVNSLYGEGAMQDVAYAATLNPTVTVPAGRPVFLRFAHMFSFKAGEGAVLEYQGNSGIWTDAGALFVNIGYTGTITAGTSNPLSGRAGFTGYSGGFVASRLDLTSLAGQSVRFRFRVGSLYHAKDADKSFGWVIDDFQVHSCETACTYVISPGTVAVPSIGGSGDVTVTTQPGCPWAATPRDTWISASSLVYKNSYHVPYVVAPNTAATPRVGSVNIGGQSLTVNQSRQISLKAALDNPPLDINGEWYGQDFVYRTGGSAARSKPVGDLGKAVMFELVDAAGYLSFWWKVSSEPGYDYLRFSVEGVEKAAISGEADWQRVILAVKAYDAIEWKYVKDGAVEAGSDCGWVDKVQFGPCYRDISPRQATSSSAAQTGKIAVTAPTGCAWLAASNSPAWLTVTAGASGSGNGTVTYSLAANTGSAPRSGSLTVGGETFIVTQHPPITPAEGVDDTHYSWTFGGAAWTGVPDTAANDADAARSGAIGNNGESSISVTIAGPVMGSFAWRVSSEAGKDFLTFSIDGVVPNQYVNGLPVPMRISGETAWETDMFYVPAGNHTLRWSYTKGAAGAAGKDAGFLDQFAAIVLTPASALHGSGTASGSVGVGFTEGLAWTAMAWSNWIHISGPSTGTGDGTLSYTVDANLTSLPRQGRIGIGGRDFVVDQAGLPCTYAIYPPEGSVGPTAQSGGFHVAAPSGCGWTAVRDAGAAWITVTGGASGSGNGTVTYSVTDNPDAAERSGAITAGGKTYTVNQMGSSCSYVVSPDPASVGPAGGTGSLTVTASAGCGWRAVSVDPGWLTITGGSGTGNGTVTFSAAANPTIHPRTTWILVAKKSIQVVQQGIPCTFTLESPGATVSEAGGAGSVLLESVPGCVWSAKSNAPWITLTGETTASGSYPIDYAVEANPYNRSRTGTLGVVGQTYTITQEAAACVYALSPDGLSFPVTGGRGTAGVTAPGGCAWTATADAAWITLRSASGSGKGDVEYKVSANPGTGTREGRIRVAGALYHVAQDGTLDGLTAPPPRTGQETVYEPGDDGDPAVRAGVPWPSPRFTNPDGGTPPDQDELLDRLTGLAWARDTYNPGPPACARATEASWADALEYVKCLNDNAWLGHGDWRLPNVNELESVFGDGVPGPASWFAAQGFLNVSTLPWWSSTTMGVNGLSAWTLDSSGWVAAYPKASYRLRAWPVRGKTSGRARVWRTGQTDSYAPGDDGGLREGSPWPMPRFSDLGSCLEDRLTGLVWAKGVGRAALTWADAVATPRTLDLCGYTDWRLPNRRELRSLMDYGVPGMADGLIDKGFSAPPPGFSWCSTTYGPEPSQAWAPDFFWGGLSAVAKTDLLPVLPVTGGLLNRLRLDITPAAYDFGGLLLAGPAAVKSLLLSNQGTGEVSVEGFEILTRLGGTFAPADAGLSACPPPPFSLGYGQSCELAVSFLPAAEGESSGLLRLLSGTPELPATEVLLTGRSRPAPRFSDAFSHKPGGLDPDWAVRLGGWWIGKAHNYYPDALRLGLSVVRAFDPARNPFGTGVIEVSVRLPAGKTANGGIVFSYQGPGRYRYVRFKPGRVEIGQVGTLGGEPGGVKRSIPCTSRQPWAASVSVIEDGTVEVSINGGVVGSSGFRRTLPGWIGLVSDHSKPLFDDFAVW